MGAALTETGLIVCEEFSELYAQLAEDRVLPLDAGSVGSAQLMPFVAQSHQLVGEYHGAPSAIHVGTEVAFVAKAVEGDPLPFVADVDIVRREAEALLVIMAEGPVRLSDPDLDAVSRVFQSFPLNLFPG